MSNRNKNRDVEFLISFLPYCKDRSDEIGFLSHCLLDDRSFMNSPSKYDYFTNMVMGIPRDMREPAIAMQSELITKLKIDISRREQLELMEKSR